jgi:hypothetical protein
MSMEHKAFIFDYEAFMSELKDILEIALYRNEVEGLECFINSNIHYLTDPYEGEPLSDNWHETIESRDPHQYGDFALTKFYNPAKDIGIGYDWVEIESSISQELGENLILLGDRIGKEDSYFDPGKMGSYFQSLNIALDSRSKINIIIENKSVSIKYLTPIIDILDLAISSNKGLYITF